jgi:hypothetical protein
VKACMVRVRRCNFLDCKRAADSSDVGFAERFRRYLVYLNNQAAGKGSVKTIDLCDQKTAPLTPKSFIYNRRSYSQAGRRGFESRLPLHSFNNLRAFPTPSKPSDML